MLRVLASFLAVCVVSTAAAAQPVPAAESSIPPGLKDWRAWVLKDLDYRACPFLANATPAQPDSFICAWPGRLTLASDAAGATFSIHWRVEAQSWVPLPGDAEHWPQQVTVNGQRQPVLAHGGGPALALEPGNHEIAGRLFWQERPQTLAVPPSIGLIALSVDSKPVAPVQRDGNAVTLGRGAAAAPEADSVEMRVYRRLSDSVPAQLDTQILFSVSGQAREEVVGPVLPAGFMPFAVSGTWPARLDTDGRLHVQVQPGVEMLSIEARATAPLASVAVHAPAAPWPKQEIWSYEAAPRLRMTTASSAVQVDPREAGVPSEWQPLPAFALGDGATLAIVERSRGIAPDEANRLTLQREAWLDFSGAGWFARDRLTGSMARGWRFDVAAPFSLEQATAQNSSHAAGNGEALLITRGAKPDLSGVEWRMPHVDLAAALRIDVATALPVAGWQQTLDGIQATLHFPFGYKLLGALGADSAAGSWASAWSLLDAFICAIAVLLAWRLLGAAGALVAAAFLVLGYQEAGVPLWTLIATLALALVVRVLPDGRLSRAVEWLRRAALVALILVALPFLADQVRYALYPQLEGGTSYYADNEQARDAGLVRHKFHRTEQPVAAQMKAPEDVVGDEVERRTLNTPPPASAPTTAQARGGLAKSNADNYSTLQSVVVTGSRIDRSELIGHYSETTVVQTGRGTPAWNLGSSAWLSWNGPVLATQSLHLIVAPPWLVRPLRIVLVALLAWLIWRLFGARSGGRPLRSATLGAAAVLLAAVAPIADAQTQSYPSPEMLQQLRQRLNEAPRCAPACANFAEAQVSASGDALTVALEAHAGERVALPLPGDTVAASLRAIRVDGVPADGAARDATGRLWIAVGRGVHRIDLDFIVVGAKIALAFPVQPARVLFQGNGWEASGTAGNRLLTETLTLARSRDAAGATPDAGTQQFPAYVRVERHLSLGLEWTAFTSVARLSPKKGGFTLDVPLLAGEHVSSPGIKVQNGKAQVAIADEDARASWQSTIDKADTLTLTAPPLTDRAEVWTIVVSPTWHADFAGIAEAGAEAAELADDYRNFEFHPLPGETLTVSVSRPAVTQGAARAIDSLNLVSEAGQRAALHTLNFVLRSSQGGEQAITLPKDAEVLAVSRDGVAMNLRAIDGKLSLPVAPGTQRYTVRLRTSGEIGLRTITPQVAPGLPAANVSLVLQMPADRWLLATWGPAVGPAVLYWGELIVMIAVAYALTRTRRTRLTFRDWLLLGLGFSTFSWLALLVVVGWLFAFDWRARAALPPTRWQFNLLQAALVALTACALLSLVSAIPQGLLGQPDMHVTGNASSAQSLRWFIDRSTDALPQPVAISLPLWVYKVLMLAWAIWLANALIGWLRDGFAAWTRGGYWRARPPAAMSAVPAAAEAQALENP